MGKQVSGLMIVGSQLAFTLGPTLSDGLTPIIIPVTIPRMRLELNCACLKPRGKLTQKKLKQNLLR
jgi:hypothetical protein